MHPHCIRTCLEILRRQNNMEHVLLPLTFLYNYFIAFLHWPLSSHRSSPRLPSRTIQPVFHSSRLPVSRTTASRKSACYCLQCSEYLVVSVCACMQKMGMLCDSRNIYFEKQTPNSTNCQVHAINNTYGACILTPEALKGFLEIKKRENAGNACWEGMHDERQGFSDDLVQTWIQHSNLTLFEVMMRLQRPS